MEWKGKTRGGTFGYSFFIFLIKKTGVIPAYAFLCLIVLYFIPFAPQATRSIWFYARCILNYSRIRSIRLLIRNYYKLGQILIDKIALGNGLKDQYQFQFENYGRFIELLNADKGAVIIGAHVGSWETGAPFFGEYGKKINIVLYDAEHQKIKEILKKNSVTADYKAIPVNDTGLSHIFAIKEALDNKEYVCFQGDRLLTDERSLKADFLGKEARFPQGPFLLASKMNVPIVFYFAMREPGRTYRFYFTIAEKKNKITEQQLLLQYIASLETILHRYPEQWFNYYNFWKE